ncbi:Ig domain-containing protein [Streptomyces chattanoogensis]|uniref:Ig domain-containing protein n=1 Tax=Streptomyces chattanoogensis TaxID=66876 RepID=UPI0036B557C1
MSAKAGSGQLLAIRPAGGTGQHARPHQTFAHPLKARLVDTRTDIPVADSEVTFVWDSMSQQALFEGDETTVTAHTDAQGYAETPPLVAGDAAGTATFTVIAEGAAPEQFEVTVDG